MSLDINIYGCGNMTQAIFLGLRGQPLDLKVNTYTPSFVRAKNLAKELGGNAFEKIIQMPDSRFHFLGCKPQQFDVLNESLKSKLRTDDVLVSIMAGKTIKTIQKQTGLSKVVRVMPSTPSLVKKGISLVINSSEVTQEELQNVINLFKGVSKVVKTKTEDEFDRITTVSGCGPAYIFEFARIFSDYLEKNNITKGTADLVALELFSGASKLMNDGHESFESLRNKVTSKGGMTFEALESFKNDGLESVLEKGLDSAYDRAKSLD